MQEYAGVALRCWDRLSMNLFLYACLGFMLLPFEMINNPGPLRSSLDSKNKLLSGFYRRLRHHVVFYIDVSPMIVLWWKKMTTFRLHQQTARSEHYSVRMSFLSVSLFHIYSTIATICSCPMRFASCYAAFLLVDSDEHCSSTHNLRF